MLQTGIMLAQHPLQLTSSAVSAVMDHLRPSLLDPGVSGAVFRNIQLQCCPAWKELQNHGGILQFCHSPVSGLLELVLVKANFQFGFKFVDK